MLYADIEFNVRLHNLQLSGPFMSSLCEDFHVPCLLESRRVRHLSSTLHAFTAAMSPFLAVALSAVLLLRQCRLPLPRPLQGTGFSSFDEADLQDHLFVPWQHLAPDLAFSHFARPATDSAF